MKSTRDIAVLATVLSLFSGSAAQATPNHSFTITNNTSLILWFTQAQGMCSAGYSGFTDIPPHSTITINWTDSNDFAIGCTDREKFIAFNYGSSDWQGWLGMVHRKINGDWYNGQFYAAKITTPSSSTYTFSDGDEPPEWINPVCSHTDTGCFGPFSEMVDDDKTDYNWQLLYKTETGYDFQYNK